MVPLHTSPSLRRRKACVRAVVSFLFGGSWGTQAFLQIFQSLP